MQKMQVAPTDCASGNLQNDIAILDERGLRRFDYYHYINPTSNILNRQQCILTNFHVVLAHPAQCLHRLATGIRILGSVTGWVCEILLRGRVAGVAHCLLHQICCLTQRHLEVIFQ